MRSTTSRNNIGIKILKVVIPLAFWLGVWQLAALLLDQKTGGHGTLLLPAPRLVVERLCALAVQAEFWRTAVVSLGRIFCGFAAGAAAGTAAAVLTSVCRPAHWVLAPAVKVVRAVPVASFIVLVLLWSPTTGLVLRSSPH